MITKIWERLYIGSLKDAEQLAAADPKKIAAVLSLCPEKVERKGQRVHYMRVSIPYAQPLSMPQFEEIMAAIEQGLRRGNCSSTARLGSAVRPLWRRHGCTVSDTSTSKMRCKRSRDFDQPSILPQFC